MIRLNLLASTALVCLLSGCGGSSIVDRAINELDPCQTGCDGGETDGGTDGGADGGTEEEEGLTPEDITAIEGRYSVADTVTFKLGDNTTETFTEDALAVSYLQSQGEDTEIDGSWSMTLDVTVADGAAKAVVTESNVSIADNPFVRSHDLNLNTGEIGEELSPEGALTLAVNGELVWFDPQDQETKEIDNVADNGSYLLIEGQIGEDGTATGVSYDENTNNADLFIGLEQGEEGYWGLGEQKSGWVKTFTEVVESE